MRWQVVPTMVALVVTNAAAQSESITEPEPRGVGKIRITRNYVAELNAKIAAIPEADRAWPLYLRAIELLEPMPDHWMDDPDFEMPASPGSLFWDEVVVYLDRNAEVLAMMREAGARPELGKALKIDDNAPLLPSPFAVNITDLARMRKLTRVMLMDHRRAVEVGDGRRAADDAIAMMNQGRLMMSGQGMLTKLVGFAIDGWGSDVVRRLLAEHPDLMTEVELEKIERALAFDISATIISEALDFETIVFRDIVQRIYTDDGRGSGRFSPWAFYELVDSWIGFEGMMTPPSALYALVEQQVMIAASVLATRRRTVEERFAQTVLSTREALAADPWIEESWAWFDDLSATEPQVVTILGFTVMPAFQPLKFYRSFRALIVVNTTSRDASRIAIALIRHHRQHGAYPKTLGELVPAFLDEVPLDPMDGQPLRYRLVDGSPLVYSLGPDRDDDGGRGWSGRPEIRPYIRYDEEPIDGDWVLWPVLDE